MTHLNMRSLRSDGARPIQYARSFANSVPITQNYEQSSAFVVAIGAANEPVNFRAIHDQDKARPAIKRRGTLSQHWRELCELNNEGYGIFATIALMDGSGYDTNGYPLKDENGRTNAGDKLANVAAMRAHYIDCDQITAMDDARRAASHFPPPQFWVQTSPNKAHVYWVLGPQDRYNDGNSFSLHQAKLAQLFNGDQRITDPTRVLRLPGFLHLKGAPHLVTFFTTMPGRDCLTMPGWGCPTNAAAIMQSLSQINVVNHGGGTRKELGDPDLAAPGPEWLDRALAKLDPNEMDRAEWISVTAAYKQAAWSVIGPDMAFLRWSEWCSQYDHNDPGENLKQWLDLTETQIGWPALERSSGLMAERIFGSRPAALQVQSQALSQRLLTPVSETMNQPRTAKWLIKGTVPAASAGIMFGQPGTGKSFIAIDMAVAVASGTAFNGKQVQPGPVIYIAGEGHAGVSNRFAAKFKHNASNKGADQIHVSNRALSFTNSPEDMQGLVSEIDGMLTPPALIIIDTLFRATAGSDVNDHAEMAKFWNMVDGLKQRYGSAVLVVHHSGRNETQRSFGSVVLLANADFEMSVSSNENGSKCLENTKQKEAEEFEPITFELKQVEIGIVESQFGGFESVTSCIVHFTDAPASGNGADKETRRNSVQLETPSAASGRKVAELLARIHDLFCESKGIGKGATAMNVMIPRELLRRIYSRCNRGRDEWRNGLKHLADPRKGSPWVDLPDDRHISIRTKAVTYGRGVDYDQWENTALDPEELAMCEMKDRAEAS